MNRRHFLTLITTSTLGLAGWRFWPEQGLFNPCLTEATPKELLNHDLVQQALQDRRAQ